MTLFSDSAEAGSRIAAVALILAAPVFPGTASADVDGALQSEMVDIALESRFRKPAAQATEAERAGVVDEIKNIVAITDLPRARELAEGPRLAAQIDLQRRVMIFQAFATDFIANNPATEQEIFNEYESQIALVSPTEFKARHILVETQAEALALIGQLDDGAEFAALASEHSSDSSGQSGGDLGWFTAEAMVKPFSDAVVALENGSYSKEPVQSQFGWHVILREDSRESTPPPLESVRDLLKQEIENRKFQDYMLGLRADESE